MLFGNIKDINPEVRESWENRIFLTIDIEWSKDEVVDYVIDIAEDANIPITWFVTHETKVLDRLRSNPLFELGIHPNFNNLLDGDSQEATSASAIVKSIIDIVPEAVSVRSHSLVYGTRLQTLYASHGLTHDVSLFVPHSTGVRPPNPFRLKDGFVRVSYTNDDYTNCLEEEFEEVKSLLVSGGATVFGFHPQHIFLNTREISLYEKSKNPDLKYADLEEMISTDLVGNRVLFEDLLKLGNK